jgi:hypothetical protein
VSRFGNIFNISWPPTSPSREGREVGGKMITFGDNITNNHPHPVSPLKGEGIKRFFFQGFPETLHWLNATKLFPHSSSF